MADVVLLDPEACWSCGRRMQPVRWKDTGCKSAGKVQQGDADEHWWCRVCEVGGNYVDPELRVATEAVLTK